MISTKHIPFDVKNTELKHSKLIEASAGTGKTYSVAIMVLRLILEEDIAIEKILMVTFTKAAVAELQSRIRQFVRTAYKYAIGESIDDENIVSIVGDVTKSKEASLYSAVQALDSLSVITIHGFCQQTISQNPFETQQSFGAELMTDTSDLIEYFVNDYWRSELNTMEDFVLFTHLKDHISREQMTNVISRALDDKQIICTSTDKEVLLCEIKTKILKSQEAEKNYDQHINSNWDQIVSNAEKSRYASKFIAKSGDVNTFKNDFLAKEKDGAPKYFSTIFANEQLFAREVINLSGEVSVAYTQYVWAIYGQLIDKVKQQISENKISRDIITYDDLITDIHKAVQNGAINDILLNQYDAVFIDEFQDTDKKQYEIFGRLFNESKIVFYIGDPKQSIYGWRKADINTYKKAKEEVTAILTMNRNFRSTPTLIEAMNNLFGIDDPFFDKDIQYVDVEPGAGNLGEMTENNVEVFPVAINYFKTKGQIVEFVKNETLRLLTDPLLQINGKSIEPSDIAVLTRTNQEGAQIKQALSSVNIPSITIDDTSVLNSSEADAVLSILSVIQNPNRGGINKVLLNVSFGFNRIQIENLDDEFHLDLFRGLRTEWHKNGIYTMLFSFYEKYNLRNNCLAKGIVGQRSLSNYYQLAEILHQTVLQSKYSPDELIVWLQREKNNRTEDYQQRIESEDKAVQISTIHKAKGLTYRIVFCPFLDLKIREKSDIYDFRDEEGYKFTNVLNEDQRKLYETQMEQENRRLIYVALTRAQYKNYVCCNVKAAGSSLKPFLEKLNPLFEVNVVKELTADRYRSKQTDSKFTPRAIPDLEIKNTFGIHSFSGLSKAHFTAPYEKAELDETYDQFIFQDMERGANMGTALHSIFEHLTFNDASSHLTSITNASNYYPDTIKEEQLSSFHQMVEEVMNVDLGPEDAPFKLNKLSADKMLPELEFYFSMDRVNKATLNDILGHEAELSGGANLEGLMMGFIDLFFEHEGRYYILDWKSNHLGNSIADYNRAGMEVAMKGSNYTLQYLIYTLAAKRYLENKIPDFDYEKQFGGVLYVFLRGVRKDHPETGVYFTKPEWERIEKLEKVLGR